MKNTLWILLCGFMLLLGACMAETEKSRSVTIALSIPDEYSSVDITGMEIKLQNNGTGLTYVASIEDNNVREVTLSVEYGFYSAVAQFTTPDLIVFNGRLEQLILTPENGAADSLFTLVMDVAKPQPLVIREFYYSGCMGDDNKNYTKDQYLVIYNNSLETVYLDSLCLGVVHPANSVKNSTFVKEDGTLMDEVPCEFMAWQFAPCNAAVRDSLLALGRTDGQFYPLNPGEEAVVATNAINHRDRHSRSVDLSHADFAFYDTDLSMTEIPTPGVSRMYKFWKEGSATAFPISIVGSALVLFKIEGCTADEYAADASHFMKDPANPSSSTLFMMIPKGWVIDGIEAVKSLESSYKRLPSSIDAGYAYTAGSGSGEALHRKVRDRSTQTFYYDTNNSSEDMEVVTPSLRQR